MQQINENPLAKHFRQPKIYLKLPSGGAFYPSASIDYLETNSYPVLPMTAKDELIMKTPDALLNGQSTVNVIQSCIPNIKNAWDIPSIDVDAILVAIRLATYGEMMDVSIDVQFEEGKEERTFQLDLRTVIDDLTSNEYENIISYNDFKFEIRPMTYRHFTELALKTFEEQRLFKVINDDSLTETKKLEKFNESFTRLTDLNINQLIKSVVAVQHQNEDAVTNQKHIQEFFENADKDIYKAILSHLDSQRLKFSIKPQTVKLSEEDIANGSPETINVPISFDQSNFFA